eukprot:112695-Pyramimonas_sp.AAC.1
MSAARPELMETVRAKPFHSVEFRCSTAASAQLSTRGSSHGKHKTGEFESIVPLPAAAAARAVLRLFERRNSTGAELFRVSSFGSW